MLCHVSYSLYSSWRIRSRSRVFLSCMCSKPVQYPKSASQLLWLVTTFRNSSSVEAAAIWQQHSSHTSHIVLHDTRKPYMSHHFLFVVLDMPYRFTATVYHRKNRSDLPDSTCCCPHWASKLRFISSDRNPPDH